MPRRRAGGVYKSRDKGTAWEVLPYSTRKRQLKRIAAVSAMEVKPTAVVKKRWKKRRNQDGGSSAPKPRLEPSLSLVPQSSSWESSESSFQRISLQQRQRSDPGCSRNLKRPVHEENMEETEESSHVGGETEDSSSSVEHTSVIFEPDDEVLQHHHHQPPNVAVDNFPDKHHLLDIEEGGTVDSLSSTEFPWATFFSDEESSGSVDRLSSTEFPWATFFSDEESSATDNSEEEVLDDYIQKNSEEDFEKLFDDDKETNLFDVEMLRSPILTTSGPLNATIGEGVLMSLNMAKRHNQTYIEQESAMRMANVLLGHGTLPSTRHTILSIFKRAFLAIKYFVYCPNCCSILGVISRKTKATSKNCKDCGLESELSLIKGNFFVILNVEPKLKSIFETEEFRTFFVKRQEMLEANALLPGVQQSKKYLKLFKRHPKLNKFNDLTYNFNIDGAAMFRTTNYSLYPIQLLVNEAPPGFQRKNIILAGLWYGKSPVMEIFLKPFVAMMNSLSSNGVKWMVNNETEICTRLLPLFCCVDSIARPQIMKTVQFNGRFGCPWCYEEGWTSPESSLIRWYRSTDDLNERNLRELLTHGTQALEANGQPVYGILGFSPLLKLKYFDTLWGFPPEYMHSVLIGVCKRFTTAWIEHTKTPYYIGGPARLRILNDRLTAIRPPTSIHHESQSLDNKGNFKAVDWKWWMFLYALPCLRGLLSARILNHLAMFVEGIVLLLQENVNETEIQAAERLLVSFCNQTEALYGNHRFMTFNLHVLKHLGRCAREGGPLWCTSAFSFEGEMKHYRDRVSGPKGVPIQIVERTVQEELLPVLSAAVQPSKQVLEFINTLDTPHLARPTCTLGETDLLGKGTQRQLSDSESSILNMIGTCVEYMRATVRGVQINSSNYKLRKHDDSTVILKNGTFGRIQSILLIRTRSSKKRCVVILKEITAENLTCGTVRLSHIFTCNITDRCVAVNVKNIQATCVLISFAISNRKYTYISIPPNNPETQ